MIIWGQVSTVKWMSHEFSLCRLQELKSSVGCVRVHSHGATWSPFVLSLAAVFVACWNFLEAILLCSCVPFSSYSPFPLVEYSCHDQFFHGKSPPFSCWHIPSWPLCFCWWIFVGKNSYSWLLLILRTKLTNPGLVTCNNVRNLSWAASVKSDQHFFCTVQHVCAFPICQSVRHPPEWNFPDSQMLMQDFLNCRRSNP